MTISESVKRERKSHVWARSGDDWYVEPEWVSKRLFEAEHFAGEVWDPCCGTGRIVQSAVLAGHRSYGSDIARREIGYGVLDFFAMKEPRDNIVCNPPFDIARQFAEHAVRLSIRKAAIIFPTARALAGHPRVLSADSVGWDAAARRESGKAGHSCSGAYRSGHLQRWYQTQRDGLGLFA